MTAVPARALVVVPGSGAAERGDAPESTDWRMAEDLSAAGCHVTVLTGSRSRAVEGRDALPATVTVVPLGSADPGGIAADIATRHASEPFDAVVASDLPVLGELAARESLTGRLWALLTRLPPPLDLLTGSAADVLDAVARASRTLLCTDERTRGLLESVVPSAVGKTVVLDDSGTGLRLPATLTQPPAAVQTSPESGNQARPRPLRVVVAGHALHFIDGVIAALREDGTADIRIDLVRSFARQDEAASRELVAWADVVICEWCSPVAVWYSRNKRAGQRLLVRLHRYELYKEWPAQLEIDAVDQVICVSPHYARETVRVTGWAPEKVTVVPNYVPADRFDRPKLAGSEFRLGFIGMVPQRKRPDLALDVLSILRREEPSFTLFIKTKMPWDDAWNRANPAEVQFAATIFRRIQRDAVLRQGVVFDPYGPDVGAWLRKIGFVLSTSDDESFHLSPAEGMASAAVPALLPWPGSDTIYHPSWIVADPSRMAESIARMVSDRRWEDARREAQRQLRATFALPLVTQMFAELLRCNLPMATAAQPLWRRADPFPEEGQ